MLARNFLSAEQLGISQAECAALDLVLGALERGELLYRDMDECLHSPEDSPFELDGGFNMRAIFGVKYDCGSTACICGWAHILAKDYSLFKTPGCSTQPFEGQSSLYRLLPRGLRRLFLFNVESDDELEDELAVADGCNEITPEEAAQALRNYRATGSPNWKEVLAERAA